MRRASWAELSMYLVVVLATAATVLPSMAQFSHKAVPAILQSAVAGTLPARLTSILDISPDYIAQHYPALQHRLKHHVPWGHSRSPSFQAATSWASNVPVLAPCVKLVQRFLNIPRDVSDVQWKEFRGSLGLLAAGMLAYVALSNLAKRAGHSVWLGTGLFAALAFLGVLHNTQAAWPLALALATYYLSHLLAGRKHGPASMWAFQVGLLVYIRYNDGMGFGRLSPGLAWLDGQGGMLRWWIHHNLAMLRMISYFMDLHGSKAPASAQQKKVVVSPAVYRSLPMYLLYCFYPPLYIAGPIITYSSWASQVTAPSRVSIRQVVTYALRWVAALFILEAFTRLYHFNAMAKYGLLTRGVLQAQGVEVPALYYILTAFIVLIFMWLKFLVIWRFFRLVSLADGVDPPENMKRCICNNYDVQGFWQGWHSSYNRWLVRYMYVPLGGSTWRVANVWVCFLFVALWHDLDLRLLAWGLLMPAAFLPEIGIKALGRSRALQPHTHALWYRHVAALLGTCNIMALVCANLVGFVTGLEGIFPLLQQVLSQPGVVLTIVGVVWCAVQLMFALREHEADWKQAAVDRKGVHGE